MAKDQLKIYTPIVWVEVLKTFLDDNHRTIYDKEYLLWDGELKDFADRKANATDIFFPRYDRFVVVGKIQDF